MNEARGLSPALNHELNNERVTMERGLQSPDEPVAVPMDRDTARSEADVLKNVLRESLREFSPRVVLPETLRTMVKDMLRSRPVDYETVLACVVSVMRRATDEDQIAYWQNVAFEFSKAAFLAVAGCPIKSWEEEMDATRAADPVQNRAIVALQMGKHCASIEEAARLTHQQQWKSGKFVRALLHASRVRAPGRMLPFTGAHAS